MSLAAAATHDPISLNSDEDGELDVDLDPAPGTPVGPPQLLSSASSEPLPSFEKKADEANATSSASPEGNATICNGALWPGPTNAASPPDSTSPQVLRASASSLSAGKVRFPSVQKGAGIGKHMNGRGVGRASKLAQLEVAAEHIGASSHHVLLTSPRLLRSPGRKKSPIRWFPRKKTESYLERKIRMLQEKEGNVASLDETLGAANLHLSRIERDKLAAQEAAAEAMNSRKGALVEASWCRILKLAGIPCKLAILELQKAEKKAAAALAEAENHSVILHHGPGERESSSEAVTASLDTAFDVDKEVTAAIKVALRHVSSSDTQFDTDAAVNRSGDMAIEDFSEAESQSDPETREDCLYEGQTPHDEIESSRESLSSGPRSKEQELSKSEKPLVSVMVDRIRDLSLEHQTALAGIVATRGLSALLKEQSLEQELNDKTGEASDCKPSHSLSSPKKASDLGSILVKHVSRLQREVQAAKETSRHPRAEVEKRPNGGRLQRISQVDSLDQILVKHVSKLEKEKLAAVASRTLRETPGLAGCKEVKEEGRKKLLEVTNTPYCSTSLGSVLVKHVSALEKERQAETKILHPTLSGHMQAPDLDKMQSESARTDDALTSSGRKTNEPVSLGSRSNGNQRANLNDIPGLGSILVKHVSRLEKEKQRALAMQEAGRQTAKPKESSCELAGLGDILVKRLSKLEIEKAKASKLGAKESQTNENSCPAALRKGSEAGRATDSADAPWHSTKAQKSLQMEGSWGGPSSITEPISSNVPRRKSLREKQLEDAWGGLSLGNTLKRHVSKLEKEQASWRRAEEEARQRPANL